MPLSIAPRSASLIRNFAFAAALSSLVAIAVASSSAAEPSGTPAARQHEAREREARYARFAEEMSNVKLVGRYTIVGQPQEGPLREEEYTIHQVRKLPEGDLWEFQARIRYGERDLTVPLALNVHWAGDTPVITLDRLFIPGLGTFDSRVVIDGDKYAGTWRHDDVGGHLFGTIEKLAE